MNYSKSITILLLAGAVSLAATDALAQRGGGRGGGGRAPSSGGVYVGRAAPRPSGGYGHYPGRPVYGRPYYGHPYYGHPYYYRPYVVGYAPYYPYYYPYRAGVSFGFSVGFGYPYGYVSASYGYPYAPYYPYGYYNYYGPYGYAVPPASYVAMQPGYQYGGVKIQGAPPDAQIFADGYYVGIADDFDGVSQHMNLTSGTHKIEVRFTNAPPAVFDVNVLPGQTITLRMQ